MLYFFLLMALSTEASRYPIQNVPRNVKDSILDGNWKNTLGSNVTFKAVDGMITGHYQTAVVSGEKSDLPPVTPLFGTYQATADGLLVTFNVQWVFSDKLGNTKQSATTWIGKLYFSTPTVFDTTWLLLSDKEAPQAWSSVTTNKDTFLKV